MSTGAYVGIPTSYTPVEYIESTGTQYIDTGVNGTWSSTLQFISKFAFTQEVSSAEQTFIGNKDTSNQGTTVYVSTNTTNLGSWCGSGTGYQIGTFTVNADNNLDITFTKPQGRNGTYNGSSFNSTTTANNYTSNTVNIALFSSKAFQMETPAYMKLYFLKIKKDGVLVRDFIPVLDENNVACLFDLVENKFYYNKGTGTFTAGSTTGEPVVIGDFARKVKKMYVGIPKAYTPVEYIESTRTQYIDTGVVPKSTTRMVYEFANTDNTANNRAGWGSTGSAEAFFVGSVTSKTAFYSSVSNNWTAVDTAISVDTNKHTFDVSNSAIKLDGVSYGTGNIGNTATSEQTLYLMALHTEYSPFVQYCGQKLYSCQIYDGSTLIRDFAPVLDDNNIPCLYDKVESKFYYNAGTGSFTYGTAGTPVAFGSFARKVKKGYVGVPVSYTPIEYIESSGTQYIDTGIPASATIKTLCDMSTSTGGYPFGVTPSQNTKYYGANVSITNQRIQSYFGTTNNYTIVENIWTQGQRFVLTANDNYKFYKDSTQIADYATGTTKEFDSSLPITIFALNGLYLSSRITMKLYGFKMYDNGTLVRDFIPVLDDNNVACLYDKVEGKFYYNAGTGTFTAGSTTGEQVVVGSVARLCFKGTTIWEAFIELCRANPTKSAASRVLQYQTQIENLMAQNGKDVNSYHSIYAYTDRNTFEVVFVVPTTYWYKYNETVSGTTYAFYISGRSGSQSIHWLSASDIRYYANTSWVDYSNNVIGVFSKASSGGSPSADCVVEVMSE